MINAKMTNVRRRLRPKLGDADQELANQAATLAGQGEWSAAAAINYDLYKRHPKDASTLNRLGKCLTELGRHKEAIACYERVLQMDPQNEIARKNAERIGLLAEDVTGLEAGSGAVDPGAFIADPGTTLLTTLTGTPDQEAWAASTPGAELGLHDERGSIVVRDRNDKVLGSLAPQLSQRLLTLLGGGNRYSVVLASIAPGEVRVLVRETFRHPGQAGKPSFPTREGGTATLPGSATPGVAGTGEDDAEEEGEYLAPARNRTETDYPETDIGEEEPADPFANSGSVITGRGDQDRED